MTKVTEVKAASEQGKSQFASAGEVPEITPWLAEQHAKAARDGQPVAEVSRPEPPTGIHLNQGM